MSPTDSFLFISLGYISSCFSPLPICCLLSFLSLAHHPLKDVFPYLFTASPPPFLSLPLFNTHLFLLAASVFHHCAVLWLPPSSLSDMVWGQLAHVSLSPATACGLEIPPSHRFKLHVSWLEKRTCTCVRAQTRARTECLLQNGVHTYTHTHMHIIHLHEHILMSTHRHTNNRVVII